jgi:uncharacterized membrane protein YphA (DoxX/SURF4 family)
MNARIIAYWTTTAFVAFALVSGALGELNQQWGTMETVTILGYPAYFLTIIGVWKLAGAAALLVPRFPRLKEWAYAGIFFNMSGAFISHAAVGDYGAFGYHLIATGSIALLALASWALRPQTRVLAEREASPTRATATATSAL